MVFVIQWHESAMDLHVFPIPIPPPTPPNSAGSSPILLLTCTTSFFIHGCLFFNISCELYHTNIMKRLGRFIMTFQHWRGKSRFKKVWGRYCDLCISVQDSIKKSMWYIFHPKESGESRSLPSTFFVQRTWGLLRKCRQLAIFRKCNWPIQETWDTVSIPGSGRSPGGEHSNPLKSVFLLGGSPGQRRLVGCSPRGWRDGHDWSDLALTQSHNSLLYSRGHSTQYSLWTYVGKESKKEPIYAHR